MTGMAREAALTAITALALCGVPATAHADADPVNLSLTDDVRTDLVQAAGQFGTGMGSRERGAPGCDLGSGGDRLRSHPRGRRAMPGAGERPCLVGLAVRQVLPTTGGLREMSSAMKTLMTAMVIAAAATVAFSPTNSAQPTDPAARPAFRPCDWVTASEASDILGKPVTPAPSDDAAGSNDPRCYYAVTGDDTGLGVNAVCVFEPQVTPPSTTVVVLLDGGRIYRATAAYEYCDTAERRFARTAIDRVSA